MLDLSFFLGKLFSCLYSVVHSAGVGGTQLCFCLPACSKEQNLTGKAKTHCKVHREVADGDSSPSWLEGEESCKE